MEINLAYEKVLQMTSKIDPWQLLGSWTLTSGNFDLTVNDEKDPASFNAFLAEHPD